MISTRSLRVPSDLVMEVDEAEYARLLGYPGQRIPDGRVRDRADEARSWYARNGDPWTFVRRVEIAGISDEQVLLADGRLLESSVLAARLRRAEAPALVVAAVSAGGEIDQQSARLWTEARPDEAYFLDRFGAAVTERLATWLAETLRSSFTRERLAMLPGFSPGHDGWDLAQQTIVAASLVADGADLPPGPFEVLSSGMITPKNSLLSVFGLTRDLAAANAAWARHRCSWCSLSSCSFRRNRFAGGDGAT